MKIACLQYDIQFQSVGENIQKVDDMLENYIKSNDKPDILVLPEMSLTGYMFDDELEIQPYLEYYEDKWIGKCVNWAIKKTQQYKINLIIGIPESEGDKYFNTSLFIDLNGKVIHKYQKHFLYEIDERWALPGPNFDTFKFNNIKMGLGICMDLNNGLLENSFQNREFANYHFDNNTELIIVNMNWIKSNDAPWLTLIYWINRILPLLKSNKQVTIIGCNRIGLEKDIRFTGMSFGLQFNSTKQGNIQQFIIENVKQLKEEELNYFYYLIEPIIPYLDNIHLMDLASVDLEEIITFEI